MIARFLALLAASAALVTSAAVAPSPARADTIGLCTATHGTIVAVDFSHWGGPIVRGCGVDSKTGYALLHDGGFTTAGDQHDGPAFICRLGNGAFHGGTQYPTPDQDACVVTPPASAYWSYWLAPRGQNTWSYSQLGAMSDVPKDGEVELWQFGSTNVAGTEGRPSVSPDSLRAKNTSPVGGASTPRTTATKNHSTAAAHSTPVTHSQASTSATHRGTVHAPGSTATSTRSSTAATSTTTHARQSTAARGSHTSTRASASSGAATGSAGSATTSPTGTSPGSAAPAIVDASPASGSSATAADSGSPTALVVGGGLVIVLAAGAGWTIVRRRRTDPDM